MAHGHATHALLLPLSVYRFPWLCRFPSGFTLSRVDGTDFTYRPRPIRNLDIEPVAYFYASLLISLLFGRVHSLAFLQYFDFFSER